MLIKGFVIKGGNMVKKYIPFVFPLLLIFALLSCSRNPVPPNSLKPVINAIEVSPNIVSKGGTVYLHLAVTDPDADKMYFDWSCTNGTFYSDSLLQNESRVANPCWWNAPSNEGNFKISVTCTDSMEDNNGSFAFVDTFVNISVSIYSLDTVIVASGGGFGSPFAMYLDAAGKMYVTDPGLSAIHYYNGSKWISWNYFGLDTTITTTTSYDTIDTIIPIIDTTKIVKTLVGKDLYDTPSAIAVDENMNFFYVANAKTDSTVMSIYDVNKMFTAEDTVTALSTVVTMSEDNGVWDTLTDTLSLDTLCLYGFQFRESDRKDLHFRISAPYAASIEPTSKWFYVSTGISVIAYDTTWAKDGWKKHWSSATSTGGINFEGKGMKVFNGKLYLASFGEKSDTVYSLVRRYTDISNPSSTPTVDLEFSSLDDTTLAYVAGLAVGPDGHIFVTEGGGSEQSLHRVVEYDDAGNYVRSFGSLGNKPDQFNFPTDIFIDGTGKIYVVDMGNACIKVFKK